MRHIHEQEEEEEEEKKDDGLSVFQDSPDSLMKY